jgi:hypothetical protein
MVNSGGKRFVDEGEGIIPSHCSDVGKLIAKKQLDYRNYTYAKFGRAIQMQSGSYAFQVWDSKTIEHLRVEEYGDGIVKKIFADSIEDLVEKLAVNGLEAKEEFIQTVYQFNEAVESYQAENLDSTWNPAIKDGMSTQSSNKKLPLPKSNWALTVDQPPFMAVRDPYVPLKGLMLWQVKVACGVTFTFGGLAIDPETAGVISETTSKVIPGLFCTGEMVIVLS